MAAKKELQISIGLMMTDEAFKDLVCEDCQSLPFAEPLCTDCQDHVIQFLTKPLFSEDIEFNTYSVEIYHDLEDNE